MTGLARAGGLPGWVRPTLRATSPVPLVATTALGAALVALESASGSPPHPWLGALLSGAVLAGAVLSLHDPAGDLLAAVPTGPLRRLTHRLACLAAPVAGAVAVIASCAAGLDVDVRVDATTVVALAAVAGAAFAVSWRRDPRTAPVVAAGAQLGWVAVAALTPAGGRLASVARAVADDPWLVVASAAAVAVLAYGHRRAAWATR